jgi:hypothetical protein
MATLPELSDAVKRKLTLAWDDLRDRCKLTAEDLDRYSTVGGVIHKQALSAPPAGNQAFNVWHIQNIRAKAESGLSPSIEAGNGRFKSLGSAYWNAWASGGKNYETYVGWLHSIRSQVLAEFASLWKGRSTETDSWYEDGCRPLLYAALSALVKQDTARARAHESRRLAGHPVLNNASTAGNPVLDEIYSGSSNLSPAAREAIRLAESSLGLRAESLSTIKTPYQTVLVDPSGFTDKDQEAEIAGHTEWILKRNAEKLSTEQKGFDRPTCTIDHEIAGTYPEEDHVYVEGRMGASGNAQSRPTTVADVNVNPKYLRQGDPEILKGKALVNFKIAEQYLGVGERQRQNLMKSGAIRKGGSRMVSTDSLKEYMSAEVKRAKDSAENRNNPQ